MAYRMKELTEHVRVGLMSSGDLDIEVWEKPGGWRVGSELGDMQGVIIPSDAVDELFEYLR